MMHNHPQDVGVTHWKPGSGIIIWSIFPQIFSPGRFF